MRLICPNCGAQYEVPTNVIPEGGRDVQCSNCGHTWFQAHPDDDPAPATEPDAVAARAAPGAEVAHAAPEGDEAYAEGDEALGAETPPDGAPQPPEAHDEDDTEEVAFEEETFEEETPPESEVAPEPPRRSRPRRELDPSVAEVLREEAEREARRRAADGGSLETQTELGLTEPEGDDAERRSQEARERMARMRGDAPEEPAAPAPAPAPEASAPLAPEVAASAAAASSRRELLPDIEEINQTLRASSERRSMETPQGRAAVEEEDEAETRGFSRGFRLVIALAIVAVALYVLAPTIAELAPGSTPLLDAYVGQIDTARLWLDGQVGALMQQFGGE